MKPTRRGQQTRRLVKIISEFHSQPIQTLHGLTILTGYHHRTIRRDLEAMEQAGVCERKKENGKLFWKLRDTLGHNSNSGS
jgi:DeoR/GlpR family transcriptional regulator of sugar metabolism